MGKRPRESQTDLPTLLSDLPPGTPVTVETKTGSSIKGILESYGQNIVLSNVDNSGVGELSIRGTAVRYVFLRLPEGTDIGRALKVGRERKRVAVERGNKRNKFTKKK